MGSDAHIDPFRAADSGLPRAAARRIAGITAILLAICSLASLSTQPSSMTFGILLGGCLVLTNFGLLYRVVEGLVTGSLSAPILITLTFGKLGLTGAVVAGAVFFLDISLFGLALGLSLLVVGIVLSPVAELLMPVREAPHGC